MDTTENTKTEARATLNALKALPESSMAAVKSSSITAAGYDQTPNTSTGTLRVRFFTGAIYAYKDVPESVHQGLMDAPSAGQYLVTHIKGKYTFVKL